MIYAQHHPRFLLYNTTFSQKWLYQFILPIVVLQKETCSLYLPFFFFLVYLMGVTWYLIVLLCTPSLPNGFRTSLKIFINYLCFFCEVTDYGFFFPFFLWGCLIFSDTSFLLVTYIDFLPLCELSFYYRCCLLIIKCIFIFVLLKFLYC
jgi:hypothetical protein